MASPWEAAGLRWRIAARHRHAQGVRRCTRVRLPAATCCLPCGPISQPCLPSAWLGAQSSRRLHPCTLRTAGRICPPNPPNPPPTPNPPPLRSDEDSATDVDRLHASWVDLIDQSGFLEYQP